MICQEKKKTKNAFFFTNKPVAVVREYHLIMLIFWQDRNQLDREDVEMYCSFPMEVMMMMMMMYNWYSFH